MISRKKKDNIRWVIINKSLVKRTRVLEDINYNLWNLILFLRGKRNKFPRKK